MATYQELRARSQQVRDEQNIGGNTALRVGQLLMDIVKYFNDNDAAASEYLQQHFAMVNDGTQLLNWKQSPIVILHTMGETYDEGDFSSLSQGENYYRAGFIMEANGQGGGINGETPKANVLYVNLANDTLYTWNGASFDAITSGGGGSISGDDILKNAYYLNGNLVLVFDTENGDKTVTIPVNFDASNYVPTSRTVNGKALSNNITISQSDIPGLVAALAGKISGIKTSDNTPLTPDSNGIVTLPPAGSTISPATASPSMDGTASVGSSDKYAREDHVHPHDTTKLSKSDVSVETQGDGTVDINVKDDTYKINLNHTHEGMAKLEKVTEATLPQTLADDTIYVQVDDMTDPQAIETLYIFGLEFAGGGGTPSTEPKIVSPIGTQIDFNGASSKTVTVRATNLSEALTIAVTGVTANLQTISANDAANGVQLTLTKGQNFDGGTLRIYSSEVDKSWTVIESQDYSTITAVKFTKQQYVETDIHPGPATRLEIDMQFDGTFVTPDGTTTDYNFIGGGSDSGKTFSANTGTVNQMNGSGAHVIIFAETSSSPANLVCQSGTVRNRSTLIIDNVSHQASFNGGTVALTTKTTTMPAKMKFGSNSSGAKPFGLADIILYSLKHYENNVLTHEYLPKTYNGVAGLYDTVTDTFISSATGTPLVAVNE